MEIGAGKEGCYKSQQGHVGSGDKGREETEGSVTFTISEDVSSHFNKIKADIVSHYMLNTYKMFPIQL